MAVVGDEVLQGLVDHVDVGQGGVGVLAGERQVLDVRAAGHQHLERGDLGVRGAQPE